MDNDREVFVYQNGYKMQSRGCKYTNEQIERVVGLYNSGTPTPEIAKNEDVRQRVIFNILETAKRLGYSVVARKNREKKNV